MMRGRDARACVRVRVACACVPHWAGWAAEASSNSSRALYNCAGGGGGGARPAPRPAPAGPGREASTLGRPVAAAPCSHCAPCQLVTLCSSPPRASCLAAALLMLTYMPAAAVPAHEGFTLLACTRQKPGEARVARPAWALTCPPTCRCEPVPRRQRHAAPPPPLVRARVPAICTTRQAAKHAYVFVAKRPSQIPPRPRSRPFAPGSGCSPSSCSSSQPSL